MEAVVLPKHSTGPVLGMSGVLILIITYTESTGSSEDRQSM
jgi:hypothetical protein